MTTERKKSLIDISIIYLIHSILLLSYIPATFDPSKYNVLTPILATYRNIVTPLLNVQFGSFIFEALGLILTFAIYALMLMAIPVKRITRVVLALIALVITRFIVQYIALFLISRFW